MASRQDDPAGKSSQERPPVRRVTLDFAGPTLRLPGESSAPGGHEGSLELDTDELGLPEIPSEDRRARAAPLDLDLGDMEPGAGRGHDGWTRERARRSSVPAATPPGSAPAAAVHRAPAPAEEPAPDDAGDALGLVDRSRSSQPPADLASEMRERFALDDFTGALRSAELLLGREPGHLEAQRYARSSREALEHLYSSRLGGLDGVPVVTVKSSEVRWLGLDHRAGFLLSRIDGRTRVEDILDLSGMPRLEALKMLAELLDANAVRIESA